LKKIAGIMFNLFFHKKKHQSYERNDWQNTVQYIRKYGTPEEIALYQAIFLKKNKITPNVVKIAWMILQSIYTRNRNYTAAETIEKCIAAHCQLHCRKM